MVNTSSGNQTRLGRTPASSVRLLAAAPDLGDFLTPEEREEANRIALPTVRLNGPVEISELLAETNSFAALVIEGMLLRQLRVGDQPALRLFGPGELIATGAAPTSMLMIESECRAVDSTRVATLGIEFMASAHRWPRLIAGLQSRMADGQERLATQMAICQLPRVADRILAILWLLAESWGHVSSSGTSLSLSLTHEALGALVGARRPTVTLAIRELTDRGALVHQDRSWLLLEPPPTPTASAAQIDAPAILGEPASPWTGGDPPPAWAASQTLEMLQETLMRLREDHQRNAENHRTILLQMIRTRERNLAIRRRIRDQVAHYPPPALHEPPAGDS
jgi:CRP/FNR family transcriptional regulator, cyclic AMP receptor protein